MDAFPQRQCAVADGARWFALSAGLVGLALSACGCGDVLPDPRGVRVPVSGSVKLDGSPLSSGRIVFESNQGNGAVKATALVVRGTFSLSKSNGPLPGTARVEIYPEPIELEQLEAARQGDLHRRVSLKPVNIPARFNVRSTLTAEIKPDDAENVLSFSVSSR
ncbi:MAG: hypothetical protein AB7I48_27945 [Planctomycetaceae bacterium]